VSSALVEVSSAHADTLVGCDTPGLISAISGANSAGSGVLDLAPGCTYVLTAGPYSDGRGPDGLPVITSTLTIHGNGATIIRDPSAPHFRLVEVASHSLAADHLTLSHGLADVSGVYGGGGMENAGTANLTDVTVSANATSFQAAQGGGGIENDGTMTLTASTVSGNRDDGGLGGGISNFGTMTITGSTVSGNTETVRHGGGIHSHGPLTLTNSVVSGNSAGDSGGGIDSFGGVTLTNMTVSGNSAGGSGGGINQAGGSVTLTNTTVSGNSAGGGGGGIFENFVVTLTSSIVANNTSTPANCFGSVTDGGYNLSNDSTCGLSASTSRSNVDPQLGPLQANGGPTQTMAPASTSPADNAIPPGTNGCGTTVSTDQRGALRPNLSGCSIGAYEYGDLGLQSLSASPSPVKSQGTLTYAATVSNAGAADATGVVLTDTLPVGEAFKSASVTQGHCSHVGAKVTCALGQVGAATTPKVVIVVKVTAAKGKTLTDTAKVSATSGDTIASNDSKTVSVTVS
jgi:uncharacterized repeat protein (TIGR01451 family)